MHQRKLATSVVLAVIVVALAFITSPTLAADKKPNIVFDTGLYNLTKPESSILVHFGKDKNEQWTLVRLKQPDGTAKQQ